MKKSLLLFLALVISIHVSAQQQYVLTGKVSSVLGDPVAFALVYVKGTTYGTSTNTDGIYQLKLAPGKYQLIYHLMGYKQLIDAVEVTGHSATHNVQLQQEDYEMQQKGTGGEDPAFAIVRNVIQKRNDYLNEVKTYQCNVYMRGDQKLISAPTGMFSRNVANALQIDLKRNSILYMTEGESQLNFEQPDHYKEVIGSSKVTGNYNAFNFNRAASLQVNFYNNILGIEGLNQRGFVSPIADNALDYYTYKFLGSTTENGKVIDKIQVIPIDEREPVFHGDIYIIDGDWRIYSVHLYVTGKSNLNFVDTLNIDQQYVPVNKDIWQPASMALTYSGTVLGFKFNGYILGLFSNYNLDPKFPKHFFNGETVVVTDSTARRDSVYWSRNRPVPLTDAERIDYHIKDSIEMKHETKAYLDSAEKARNHFGPVSYTFFGDTIKHYKKHEIITINPPWELIQYNTIEGWLVDFKPTYTKQYPLGRQYTISPEVRYGFDDHTFSINTSFNYRYNPAKQGVIYGEVGTAMLDINNLGSTSIFVNSINSLFFKQNTLKLYRSKYIMAGTQKEVARGLLLDGNLEYAQRTALQNSSNRTVGSFPDKEFTSNNPFDPAPNAPLLFEQNNALTLRLSATYTFDENYTTTPTGRIYEPSKYPKIKLNYRKGIDGLGSTVDYDYADLQVYQDRINLGLYGYSAFLITAGNFFNTNSLTYPDYKWFRGNQGLTFEPGINSFHFLPFYTYSQSTFLEAHYEHNFSGFLLNKVPYLRNLKLEEIIGGNFLIQKGQPSLWETYIGIQRFFLRMDYGVAYRGNGHFDQGITIYYGI